MNRNFAIFLAALGILIVFCSINSLKLKTECTSKRSQLATLESQLAELKEDNDAYESQVTSSEMCIRDRYYRAYQGCRSESWCFHKACNSGK